MTSLDEAALLADGFAVPRASLTPLSREPLGDGSVAGFRVAHDDGRASIAYVDTSRRPVDRETGLVLEGVARIWTHPADPHLPALVPVAFGDALGVLLARLGIELDGRQELLAYRPGRRAVLRAPTTRGPVWIKVVPPRRAQRIVDAHAALGAAGAPVPAVHGWSPDGVIVTAHAPGEPALAADADPDAVLGAVDALRERIATADLAEPARARTPARLRWYAPRAAAELPGSADAAERIRARCEAALAADPPEPRPIHGDLHLGQVFLDEAPGEPRITGLVDVDTAGIGDPDEDPAALVAHTVASALLTEGLPGEDRVWRLAEAAHARAASPRVDALAAIHLLGHALAAGVAGESRRAARLIRLADAASAGRRIRRGE